MIRNHQYSSFNTGIIVQHESDDEAIDRTRDGLVELQSFLGEKKCAHTKAVDIWYENPTSKNWCEVIILAHDLRRIRASISELTGEPIPKSEIWGT